MFKKYINKKNLRSQKFSKNHFSSKNTIFFLNILFLQKKSSLFLNIKNTRYNQSSLVQPNPENKNLEKTGKISKITSSLLI